MTQVNARAGMSTLGWQIPKSVSYLPARLLSLWGCFHHVVPQMHLPPPEIGAVAVLIEVLGRIRGHSRFKHSSLSENLRSVR